jgi:hypothetical protein
MLKHTNLKHNLPREPAATFDLAQPRICYIYAFATISPPPCQKT